MSRSSMPRDDITNHENRNAYMTFLEIQLERATQACNQTKQAQESIFQMNQKVSMHEEKIVNISRLVKLLQSYSDA